MPCSYSIKIICSSLKLIDWIYIQTYTHILYKYMCTHIYYKMRPDVNMLIHDFTLIANLWLTRVLFVLIIILWLAIFTINIHWVFTVWQFLTKSFYKLSYWIHVNCYLIDTIFSHSTETYDSQRISFHNSEWLCLNLNSNSKYYTFIYHSKPKWQIETLITCIFLIYF